MTYVKFPVAPKSLNGFVDGFFNDFPSILNKTFTTDVSAHAPVNITELTDSYKIELSVPGRNKEDFKIEIDKNMLSVSFEKKEETKDENEKYVRNEFSYSSFKRTFTLDDKVDSEKISAKYENGILILNVPKKEELLRAPKQVEIQ